MSETLVKRDGWLYVRDAQSDTAEPKIHILYWAIGVTFFEFAGWFNSTEEARKRIGITMQHLGNGRYRDTFGLAYRLTEGGATKSAFSEMEEVPAPPQRGRKLETAWRDGAWYKYTRQGWKLA